MGWLNSQKLWSEPASQREGKGMGGVELPAVQGTVPVWDVPSFFLSLPASFWLCPPSPVPALFAFLESPLLKDGKGARKLG